MTISADEIKRVKGLGCLNNKGTDNFSVRVITRNGKVTAKEMQCITEAASKFGNGEMAMTTRLTVEIQAVPFEKIEPLREFLAGCGLETGGTGTKVRPIVSCKGTTCQYGIYDTFALSQKAHEMFYKGYEKVKLPHKFKIAFGGCPNNCVKPNLNDIGIVGQRVWTLNEELCKGCKICQIEKNCPMGAAKKSENGKVIIDKSVCNSCGRCIGKCPFKANADFVIGYKVYIGGRWGKKVAFGKEISTVFTSEEEALKAIEKAILLFKEQGKAGERFADTVNRIGFEKAEKAIISDDILSRKENIINEIQ